MLFQTKFLTFKYIHPSLLTCNCFPAKENRSITPELTKWETQIFIQSDLKDFCLEILIFFVTNIHFKMYYIVLEYHILMWNEQVSICT